MNNIDILEEPKDILFKIDMQLYDEFNDKFCEIEENLGTVYSYKDLEDLKKAESDTERTLLREAISTLIAENKALKEENEGLKIKLDTLIEKYKELKEEKETDYTSVYLKGVYDERDKWQKKIKEMIEELETMYDGLSKNPKEHLHSKTEYKIVIGVLQELLDERNNTDV